MELGYFTGERIYILTGATRNIQLMDGTEIWSTPLVTALKIIFHGQACHMRPGINVSPNMQQVWLDKNRKENNIQLSPEGEVNSGGYIPRREASRYIFTALRRP